MTTLNTRSVKLLQNTDDIVSVEIYKLGVDHMKNKLGIIFALTVIVGMTVSAQDASSIKKKALEDASAKLVELSTFITTMTKDLAEKSAADPSFSQTEEFSDLQNRIAELRETQNTTFALIQTLNEVPAEENAAIDSIVSNVNIAHGIGEAIFYGQRLNEVLAISEEASSLSELVEASNVILTEGVADVDQASDGLAEVPNIYNNPSQTEIYQAVINTLHVDFRESTTTPDGGGFDENDATQV